MVAAKNSTPSLLITIDSCQLTKIWNNLHLSARQVSLKYFFGDYLLFYTSDCDLIYIFILG